MDTTRKLTAGLAVLISTLGLAAAASAASSPAAKSVSQSASAALSSGGTVTATLSYTPGEDEEDHNVRLTITRAGQQLVSGPLASRTCAKYCTIEQWNGQKSIHVMDIQGNGEPDVWADFYTGGAHCCTVTDFYTYDPAAHGYRVSEADWGDPAYRLEKLGRQYVFATDNDAFAYEFTDYAASGEPIKLLSFNGTQLVDVTRDHPGLIRADAAFWLRNYHSRAPEYADANGAIAAWAADEDELGNQAMVARYLTAQAAAGHLNGGPPDGPRFITALDRFLKRQGYLK